MRSIMTWAECMRALDTTHTGMGVSVGASRARAVACMCSHAHGGRDYGFIDSENPHAAGTCRCCPCGLRQAERRKCRYAAARAHKHCRSAIACHACAGQDRACAVVDGVAGLSAEFTGAVQHDALISHGPNGVLPLAVAGAGRSALRDGDGSVFRECPAACGYSWPVPSAGDAAA